MNYFAQNSRSNVNWNFCKNHTTPKTGSPLYQFKAPNISKTWIKYRPPPQKKIQKNTKKQKQTNFRISPSL